MGGYGSLHTEKSQSHKTIELNKEILVCSNERELNTRKNNIKEALSITVEIMKHEQKTQKEFNKRKN